MNNDDIIKELQEENNRLKEQLDKYLLKNKTYYEKNKEEHKTRVKDYQKKTNYKSNYIPTTEQKKEYARRAYLKKKEKLQKEIEQQKSVDEGNI
jgi:hypothetical protein